MSVPAGLVIKFDVEAEHPADLAARCDQYIQDLFKDRVRDYEALKFSAVMAGPATPRTELRDGEGNLLGYSMWSGEFLVTLEATLRTYGEGSVQVAQGDSG